MLKYLKLPRFLQFHIFFHQQSFSHFSEAQLFYYHNIQEDLPIFMFLLFGTFAAIAVVLFLVLTSSVLVAILFEFPGF